MTPDEVTEVAQILITIKIPIDKLDQIADELKIEASLTEHQMNIFVKTPFWNG
jgi:hypothetical protein